MRVPALSHAEYLRAGRGTGESTPAASTPGAAAVAQTGLGPHGLRGDDPSLTQASIKRRSQRSTSYAAINGRGTLSARLLRTVVVTGGLHVCA